ncbi:MAG TPA: S46 family peptidase, partial [Clostridia bacterium]|nr:S46 family peptidase [Clostridia bacterium]
GGDPDNFEYPRFNLDICFFRVYENGQPAKVKHYLKWSKAGPAENDLVFVSGHPGRTDRLRTVSELEFMRDSEYPRALERLKRLEVLLNAFGARSQENQRRARADLRGVENGRKVREGMLAGLLDPELMDRKRDAEQKLRSAVMANPALSDAQTAWDRIAQAQKVYAEHAVNYDFLERGYGFNSSLFVYARHLLRAAEERPKPNGERLEDYRASALPSLELELFADQPIYNDLETVKLADGLTYLTETLGYNHPLVQKLLAGKSPRERASEAVRETKVASPSVRRTLYQGGQESINQANDPMIEMARIVDQDARAVRSIIEVQREVVRQAHARIGKARYALEGSSQYPDATSSLRLSFGTVKGYEEEGRHVPFQTTYAGLYQRAQEQNQRPPFDLPQRWIDRRKKLNLSTPFNFVCTADIIGGNSGSPVVNRNGEFVGIVFDGNIQSLTADFIYTEEQARAISVHSSAIIEALKNIYNARPLVNELLSAKN